MTDEFGVKQYPYGVDGTVDLHCKARKNIYEKPKIDVSSTSDLDLYVIWPGGSYTTTIKKRLMK